MDYKCVVCGADISHRSRGAMYCGEACKCKGKRAMREKHTLTCRHCKEQFTTTNWRAVYCGGKCIAEATRKSNTMIHCQLCDKQVLIGESVVKRFCSEKCYHDAYNKLCVVCGARFKASKINKDHCSNACRKKNGDHIGTEAYRKNLARSKRRSGEKQELLILFLAERDGMICHICGEPVSMTPGPRNKRPSVDHVIPLTKGGRNTPGNVRLAHMGCNTSKGNR